MVNPGDAFEIEVFEFFEQEIKDGHLGNPSLIKIHRKKKYPSMRRSDGIVTDVSVEFYRDGATSFWFLWIIECKFLSRRIDVSEIEEFQSKLQQINAHKGTMATRIGYAKGAIEVAESAKIGLCTIQLSGAMKHLLEEVYEPDDPRTGLCASTEQELEGLFVGLSGDGYATYDSDEFVKREASTIHG